jgi:PcfJ-like protein
MANRKKRLELELAEQERIKTERAALQRADQSRKLRSRLSKARQYATSLVLNPSPETDNFIQHCLRYGGIRKMLPQLLPLIDGGQSGLARPFSDWQPPKRRGARHMAMHLLRHAFVQYEIPELMLRQVLDQSGASMTTELFQMFLHLAEGKNLRTFKYLPETGITKRAAHLFHSAPAHLEWGEAVYWAQARAADIPQPKALQMARFKWLKKEKFSDRVWMDLLVWVAKYPELMVQEVVEITRFVYHQYLGFYGVRFPDVTAKVPALFPGLLFCDIPLSGIRRRMEEQDTALQYVKKHYNQLQFPQSPFMAGTIEKKGWIYHIQPLNNLIELAKEGRAMHHCVRTYHDFCHSGISVILSMTRVREDQEEKVGTIELSKYKCPDWKVDQFKARFNCRPYPDGFAVLAEWLSTQSVPVEWDGKRY